MKNILIITLFLVLASCQQMAETEAESRSLAKLRLSATTLSQSEIGQWDSAVEKDVTIIGEETHTRAASEAVSRMAFALLDEDGNKIVSQEKSSGENGYLNFYAEVPPGTYRLIAFGHNGGGNVTIGADCSITPPGDKLTDSFLYSEELTLSETDERDKSITLNRCVAKFAINHTDEIPTGVSTIEIATNGTGSVLNAKTGLAASTGEQTTSISIPASAAGSKDNTFAIFVFLDSEEDIIDFTAKAKDANGNIIASHSFEDIPMEINMQTICTGVFFHADQDISVSVNYDWKSDKGLTF